MVRDPKQIVLLYGKHTKSRILILVLIWVIPVCFPKYSYNKHS